MNDTRGRVKVAVRLFARTVGAAALAFATACGAKTGTQSDGPDSLPAVVIVTVIQPPASPVQHVGFPPTLPRGVSTLQITAIDSAGRNITLDAARYRFDATPATQVGVYTLTNATNTTVGANVLLSANVAITWRLVDVTNGRIAVGPTVTNVLMQ